MAAIAALAVACGGGAGEANGRGDTATAANGDVGSTPEITGIDTWLNGGPTTIAEELARGRVVLIDFWTYTCINCIRTLPFITDWDEKYRDHGLTIIGVHSPEFDFEHRTENVADAMLRHGIEYPVAQDNDFATWQAFRNRFWPAKYLVGNDGSILYQHFGEGQYLETEQAIRDALTAAGWDIEAIPIGGMPEPERDPEADGQTRELYGGYERNYHSSGLYAAQDTYYDGADRTDVYIDIDTDEEEREHQQWYLEGVWRNEREAIVHARETVNLEDYIALRVVARSVNVVLDPREQEPYVVVIELDGQSLRPDQFGADVTLDEEGRSVIVVDEPRAYAIVELPAYGDHELKLRSNSDDFAIFAFTFGIYTEGA